MGKSSLINTLLNRRGTARISKTPGKTRSANYFLINDRYYFVDMPGYGYAKVSKTEIALALVQLIAVRNGVSLKRVGIVELIKQLDELVLGRRALSEVNERLFPKLMDGALSVHHRDNGIGL